MKFIAAFLACIVAAQATSIAVPSYDYWCAHNFHVLPARSYYCFSLPISQNWCTAKYYADCLVEFPQQQDPSCEAEQTDLDAFIAGYEVKLAAARAQIETELNTGLTAFKDEIDAVHLTYVNTYKEYLKNVYAEGTDEYNTRVTAYEAELLAIRTRAVNSWIDAVANAMSRIADFHARILASFRTSLETRITRIGEFNSKMDQRSTEIVGRYRTALEKIVARRVEFVQSVFDKLYADKEKHADHEAAIANYSAELAAEVNALVDTFQGQVDIAIAEFKEKYRCNYKVFFATGCYSFNRKSSSKSCSFPSPPKYSYKMVGVGAFKVDWNGAKYECLQTCTQEEKTCSFDDQVHLTEIGTKAAGYKVALSAKVSEWKNQVAEWKSTADAGLEEKITCMLPQTFCGVEPTEAEIEAFRQKLRTQAQTWINETEQSLLAQIDALETRITESIDCWKTNAEAYIAKVTEQFNACVTNKNAKIASYKTCLETRKTEQRAKLVTWLNKAAADHKTRFDLFYVSAFGETPADALIQGLKGIYHGCVDTKVGAVLAKFDAYWAEWQPQLEEHYTCGFKCSVTLKTPCLSLSYKWNFCAPAISLCKLQ